MLKIDNIDTLIMKPILGLYLLGLLGVDGA